MLLGWLSGLGLLWELVFVLVIIVSFAWENWVSNKKLLGFPQNAFDLFQAPMEVHDISKSVTSSQS